MNIKNLKVNTNKFLATRGISLVLAFSTLATGLTGCSSTGSL